MTDYRVTFPRVALTFEAAIERLGPALERSGVGFTGSYTGLNWKHDRFEIEEHIRGKPQRNPFLAKVPHYDLVVVPLWRGYCSFSAIVRGGLLESDQIDISFRLETAEVCFDEEGVGWLYAMMASILAEYELDYSFLDEDQHTQKPALDTVTMLQYLESSAYASSHVPLAVALRAELINPRLRASLIAKVAYYYRIATGYDVFSWLPDRDTMLAR